MRRDRQFHMLLTESERAALYRLAELDGVTSSDWLRRKIRENAKHLAVYKHPSPRTKP